MPELLRIRFDVPILFIMFNRPENAIQVFDRIKNIQPAELFIAIDGPRENNDDDQKNVQACIALIDKINWPCKIRTLIQSSNLGCKKAVSLAISWFFNQVDFGIILEDDCLPNQDFFYYCEQLLYKYIDNTSIMYIGGTNFLDGKCYDNSSYYFSKLSFMWGWATWRRAWELYDVAINSYPEFEDQKIIKNIFRKKHHQLYWSRILRNTFEGKIDTWDYQWMYCVWINNGLCILPSVNLISNIGYGADATHTAKYNKYEANRPLVKLSTEDLKHPTFVIENSNISNYLLENLFFKQASLKEKIKIFLRQFLS